MQFEFLFDQQRLMLLQASRHEANRRHEESLRVGLRQVSLRFVRHPRARRYVLRLCSDGTARVTIPRRGSLVEGRRFANRNIRWLEKQFLRQASRAVAPKEWTAGIEILFRGEKVRLEVREAARTYHAVVETLSGCSGRRKEAPSDAGPTQISRMDRPDVGCYNNSEISEPEDYEVRLGGEVLRVRRQSNVEDPKLTDFRPSVESHLRKLAANELPARVAELAAQHHFEVRRISVRNQRSRWGSCSRQGTISLNWRLVQTPAFVRDYIILHELAHLKELNHSKRFWREVARLCPEFATAERWLKEHSELFR